MTGCVVIAPPPSCASPATCAFPLYESFRSVRARVGTQRRALPHTIPPSFQSGRDAGSYTTRCEGMREGCERIWEGCEGMRDGCERIWDGCEGTRVGCGGMRERCEGMREGCQGMREESEGLSEGREGRSEDRETVHEISRRDWVIHKNHTIFTLSRRERNSSRHEHGASIYSITMNLSSTAHML